MNAFVILFGAILISSLMPALAEIAFLNSSPEITASCALDLDNSISNYYELNNSSAINNESIKLAMLKLPLSFIENRGQSSDDVKFMVKTSGQTVFFTPSEVVFALSSNNSSSVVRLAFEDSKPREIVGEGRLLGTANFFIGNDLSNWVRHIPTYGAIRYKDIYPGVDLVFKGTEARLKHELVLNSGIDPKKKLF